MRYLLSLLLLVVLGGIAWAEGVLSPLANPTPSQFEYFTRQAAQRTLTNTTSDQALFASDRDVLNMVAGVYKFTCQIRLEGMSGTIGNAIFKPLGTGTATITAWNWHLWGFDASAGSTPVAEQASHMSGTATAASMVTAATGTMLFVRTEGTFDMTVGGTMIPQVGLVTAIAATVEAGTYCHFVRLGATGLNTIGDVQ